MLSSTDRLFRYITTLLCGKTNETRQPELETRLTLYELNILLQTIVVLTVSEGFFLRVSFYIHLIGYMECSVLEKIFWISANVTAGKFPLKNDDLTGGSIYIYIYIYIYSK